VIWGRFTSTSQLWDVNIYVQGWESICESVFASILLPDPQVCMLGDVFAL
jgi:hypothetical protein